MTQLLAQKWQNIQTIGGAGNENPGDLHCTGTGDCVSGFTFQQSIKLGDRTLTSRGGSDYVLMRRTAGTQQYRYFTHAGGPLDEEVVAVRSRRDGGLLCTGVFWRELVLTDTTIRSKDGGKAIFLIAYRPDGRVDWAKVINGSGLKSVSDLVLDDTGAIWLSGFFGDSLFVEQKNWVASGETDAFVLCLESRGSLRWLSQHGERGNTQALGLAEIPGLGVAAFGYFDGRARFGNEVFTANTTDQDLFIGAWAFNGTLAWARKAGGVFDATPVDLVADAKGNVYFCGNIVGVIRFDGGLSIQSRDGNADIFLGAIDRRGLPLWAKTYSGEQVQECAKILFHQNKLYLAGYTLGNFNLGGQNLNPSDGFTSFLGTFDTLGAPLEMSILDADGGLFVGSLAATAGPVIQIAGVYRGPGGVLGASPLPPTSSFDFFTADFSNLATGISPVLTNDPSFKVFPTPTTGIVEIQTTLSEDYTAYVVDQMGRVVFEKGSSPTQIDLSRLSPGGYILQIRRQQIWSIYPLIRR